ncbi:MAG: hypothetical protein HY040_12875 [Planctomycetes bacterium]|nr:hypothetical protein [Planctomycetota bacterium]
MRRRYVIWTVFGFASFAAGALGQTPPPRLTHVLPPGGQIGTTLEITLVGADLDKAEALYFSIPGVKSEIAGTSALVPADLKKKPPASMKQGPQTSQKFKVTLPDNAPLGVHDIRIITAGGISNPRAFVVGDLKEIMEKEPNDDVNKAQPIELNSTVSGVISAPTDVDYFQFAGKKGQRVVLSCLTGTIDSKLPVEMKLFGPGDRDLGSNRGYQNNDALLDAVLPADGDYLVRLCSFTYTQGGPDYFYRLTVTTGSWIDAVFPPTVELGKEAKVAVYGRNLPGGVLDPSMIVEGRTLEKVMVAVKAPADPRALHRLEFPGLIVPASSILDGFEFRLPNKTAASNPYLLTFARSPVIPEEEPNDTPETAQKVPVPCEIAGRIDKKGDRDWFRFEAKKGQALGIEVFGDRLGSATDLYFVLRDEKGKTLAEQDDNPDIAAPHFFTRTEDPPRYRFVPSADGAYLLMIGARDANSQFGPRHLYTVRIAPDEPDFRLVAMPFNSLAPDSAVLHQGSHQALQVFAFRLGGFTGDITLSADSLPEGVTLPPQVIAGSQKQAALVLSATPNAPFMGGPIRIVGTATVGGQKLIREVRSASVSWPVQQLNIPTISRLDRELVMAVRDKAPYTLGIEKTKVIVQQGEKIQIPIRLNVLSPEFKSTVQLVSLSMPTGMTMQPASVSTGKESLTLNFDAKANVLPGNYTLIVRGQTQPVGKPMPPKGPPNVVQTAPPVTVTIVPKQLAKLSVPANPVKIAVGKEGVIPVKVARQLDYAGPFKLDVVLPPDIKGVTGEPSSIKPGENDGKITIRVEPGAQAGSNVVLQVRAIALFNSETPVAHEAKVTLNIAK